MADQEHLEQKQPKTTSTGLSATTTSSKNGVIDRGVEKLAALYCREVNIAWLPIWEEALADLDEATIQQGFSNLARTFVPTAACPFPTPAHLRKPLEKHDDLKLEQEAEDAWKCFITVMEKFWFADLGGWKDNAWAKCPRPVADVRTLRAVESAGGVQAIYNADHEQLVWRKKEFLAAYLREARLGETAPELIDQMSARRALREVQGFTNTTSTAETPVDWRRPNLRPGEVMPSDDLLRESSELNYKAESFHHDKEPS